MIQVWKEPRRGLIKSTLRHCRENCQLRDSNVKPENKRLRLRSKWMNYRKTAFKRVHIAEVWGGVNRPPPSAAPLNLPSSDRHVQPLGHHLKPDWWMKKRSQLPKLQLGFPRGRVRELWDTVSIHAASMMSSPAVTGCFLSFVVMATGCWCHFLTVMVAVSALSSWVTSGDVAAV